MDVEYDNPEVCPVCLADNEIGDCEFTQHEISYVTTKCTVCGHDDEWAYGWYRYGKRDEP